MLDTEEFGGMIAITLIQKEATMATGKKFWSYETEEIYGAQTKYLRSHQLQRFMECPKTFIDYQTGKIPDQKKACYEFGTAGHLVCLQGREIFDLNYESQGWPKNKGKFCRRDSKAYKEWEQSIHENGMEVIRPDDYARAIAMMEAMAGHKLVQEILETSKGYYEAVVRVDKPECLQIRCDDIMPDLKVWLEFKTTKNLRFFEADIKRFGYLTQICFYRKVLLEKTGEIYTPAMIAVETQAPFRCGVWQFTEKDMEARTCEIDAALRRLQACKITGKWPDGFEDIQTYIE